MGHIRGTDEGEVALVGDREDDPPVRLLQDIGLRAVIEPLHDDMATLDEPDRRTACEAERAPQGLTDPGTSGVDDHARTYGLAAAGYDVADCGDPGCLIAMGGFDGGARPDFGAALARIHGVEHHEAAILDPAIRISEPARQARLQRRAQIRALQAQGGRAGQGLQAGEVVVEKQTEPQHPGRA